MASLAPDRQLAWDCATGSGQAAVPLAAHFERVEATDLSAKQLEHAEPHPKVRYSMATAEASGLKDASVSLTCVAQAYHWFDREKFHAEVRRVSKPGAALVLISYGKHRLSPELDAIGERYYTNIIGPYWPPERRWVEAGYEGMELLFDPIPAPAFELTARWSFEQLMGYLGSWSATAAYQKKNGNDPRDLIRAEMEKAWGKEERELRWPLVLKAVRVA
jgi:ubiquinone/menaquinone biosynthesis C-methylase UbiE